MDDRAYYDKLEERIDNHECRLNKIETSLDETKQIVREGFADVKTTMSNLYAERAEWGKWARESLTACGKWFAKYGGIIILAALGLANIKNIAAFYNKSL